MQASWSEGRNVKIANVVKNKGKKDKSTIFEQNKI